MVSELIRTYFPEYENLFKQFPYEIQRCDFCRYCILSRYGGMYADMDTRCLRTFADVREKYPNDVLLVQTPNTIGSNIVSNSLMISWKRDHPFWKLVMMECYSAIHTTSHQIRHFEIMYTTGPALLSKGFNKYKSRYKMGILPAEFFNPSGIRTEELVSIKDLVEKQVYSVHLGLGSWEELGSKMLVSLFCVNWRIIILVLLLLLPNMLVIKV